MSIKKKLAYKEFINREYGISHMPYEEERKFFSCIREGDEEGVRRQFQPLGGEKMGRLSRDNVQNLKYHFAITVAFITRACIQGGMEMEEAYNLSDIYITAADECKTEKEIQRIHKETVDAYVASMKKLRRKNRYSRVVSGCMDYVYDHLHTKILLSDIADYLGLSPSYVSRQFQKDAGIALSEYITEKRIAAAKNMLLYSEYSISEIAQYLCFGTESYFIMVFRKKVGETPGKFRKNNYRNEAAEGTIE